MLGQGAYLLHINSLGSIRLCALEGAVRVEGFRLIIFAVSHNIPDMLGGEVQSNCQRLTCFAVPPLLFHFSYISLTSECVRNPVSFDVPFDIEWSLSLASVYPSPGSLSSRTYFLEHPQRCPSSIFSQGYEHAQDVHVSKSGFSCGNAYHILRHFLSHVQVFKLVCKVSWYGSIARKPGSLHSSISGFEARVFLVSHLFSIFIRIYIHAQQWKAVCLPIRFVSRPKRIRIKHWSVQYCISRALHWDQTLAFVPERGWLYFKWGSWYILAWKWCCTGHDFWSPSKYIPKNHPSHTVIPRNSWSPYTDNKCKLYVLEANIFGSTHEITRGLAILHAIHRAIITSPEVLPNIEFAFSVSDIADPKHIDKPIWALTRDPAQNQTWIMSDFGYWSWPIDLVGGYEQIRQEITSSMIDSNFAGKKKQVIWRGAKKTNNLRNDLLRVAKGQDWADVQAIEWSSASDVKAQDSQKALSMVDHCRYQFVLQTEGVYNSGPTVCLLRETGHSYSGRGKYLHNCNSVVIMHKRTWIEPHHNLLVSSWPKQNFVEVERDFSDLGEKIQDLLSNQDKAAQIARNGVAMFRDRYLTPAAQTCYWRHLFRAWAEVSFVPILWDSEPYEGIKRTRGVPFETFVWVNILLEFVLLAWLMMPQVFKQPRPKIQSVHGVWSCFIFAKNQVFRILFWHQEFTDVDKSALDAGSLLIVYCHTDCKSCCCCCTKARFDAGRNEYTDREKRPIPHSWNTWCAVIMQESLTSFRSFEYCIHCMDCSWELSMEPIPKMWW